MKPRVVSGDGHVEAIEGTQVKIHASANQPMARSRIEFDPIVVEGQFKGASSVRDLDTKEKEIHGEWLLKLDEKKNNPTYLNIASDHQYARYLQRGAGDLWYSRPGRLGSRDTFRE